MSHERGLPPAWAVAQLSETSLIVQGQSPPGHTYNTESRGLPFFQGKAEFGDVHPVARQWCSEPRKVAELGDVLISVRAPVGPTNLADQRCCIGRGLAAIRPAKDIPSRYLLYYLRHSADALARQATGSTFKAISGKQLRAHPVVVSPLPEQHRIVEAIETQFTRLDAAIETLRRVQANLKRYRASVLEAAVEGRLVPTEAELARQEGRDYEPASVLLERILEERRRRWEEAELARMKAKGKEPKGDGWKAKYKEPVEPDTQGLPVLPEGWCWATLGSLCTAIGDVDHKMPKAQAQGIPYVSTRDFSGFNSIGFDGAKRISHSDYQRLCRKIQPAEGDILVSRYGTVGQVRLIEQCPDFQASYSIAILKPVDVDGLAGFLSLALRADPLQEQMREHTRATSQPDLGLAHIRLFSVPIAPAAEQPRILEVVEDLLSVTDSIAGQVQRDLRRCVRLRQSILKWAFEGKLADQDPSDERASVLLAKLGSSQTGKQAKLR